MDLDKLTNEELALLYQQGNEEAYNIIHNRFQRMAKKFYYMHVHNDLIENEEILSACQNGIYNAVLKYTPDKQVSLSTMIYRYIQSGIGHKYDYISRRGREQLKKYSISIDAPIEAKESLTPLVTILNYEDSEDKYFLNDYYGWGDVIEHALSQIEEESIREYIIPVITGEIMLKEASEITGIRYQTIQRRIHKFKKSVITYSKEHSFIA